MREWDNSSAPQLGDRRTSPGCFFLFVCGVLIVLAVLQKLLEWIQHWTNGGYNA